MQTIATLNIYCSYSSDWVQCVTSICVCHCCRNFLIGWWKLFWESFCNSFLVVTFVWWVSTAQFSSC